MTPSARCMEMEVARSVEDRPIQLVACNADDSQTRWNTLFIGVFHGDEGISGQLLDAFVTDLRTAPDALAQAAADAGPFGVLSVLSPDGLVRKSRLNARGVDLNRNYPTADWAELNAGTPYYSGTEAASEPETRLVLSLIAEHHPRKIVTVHSPYEVINYDGPALALAEAMGALNGFPVVGDIGYATPGSFGTYAGKERDIPVITLELPDTEDLSAVWPRHRAALYAALAFDVPTEAP